MSKALFLTLIFVISSPIVSAYAEEGPSKEITIKWLQDHVIGAESGAMRTSDLKLNCDDTRVTLKVRRQSGEDAFFYDIPLTANFRVFGDSQSVWSVRANCAYCVRFNKSINVDGEDYHC